MLSHRQSTDAHKQTSLGDRLRGVPRSVNVLVVILPFAAFILAVVLSWGRFVGWTDLAILMLMYLLTTLGITVGFHRLLTHRAFETHPWLMRTFAVLGSMAVEGPVIIWVADHRQHH